MPPEEIARLAELHGLPVEHFAEHSVVHTADGPVEIAHGAPLSSHPSAVLPPRGGATSTPTPRARARPPTSTQHIVFADDPGGGPIPGGEALQSVRRLDDARAQVAEYERQQRDRGYEQEEAAQLARLEAGGRLPEEAHARDVEYVNARAPQVGADGALPPDVQRQLDADREMIAQRGELAGLRGSGALSRAASSHGVAARPPRDAPRVTASPEAQDRVAAELMTQRPDLAYGPEAVVGERRAAPMPPAAAVPVGSAPTGPSALGDIAASARRGFAPGDAAIDTSGRQPPTAGEWVDDGIMGAPRGVAGDPSSAPIATSQPLPTRGGAPVRGGVARSAPAPMTLPDAAPAIADAERQYGSGFGQTIDDLAGGPRRREPDLIDRQALLDQQRAGLAERAAQTQQHIEQQVEQQRQQHEADRQHAMASAQQRYQNAIDRVASMHLDPSHYFRDGGNAVGSVIAVALGALGQAFTGSSTNDALAMINQAIERDLDAQRSDMDSARAGADMQGNMIDIMRGEFGDRAAADAAAHSAMLQQAALHVQEMEAGLQGQEALNNADALRQQLEAASQEARQQAEDRQATLDLHRAQTLRELARAQQEAIRADRMGNGGGAHPHVTSAQLNDFQSIMRANPEISREEGAYLAGLPQGFVPSQSGEADSTHQRAALDQALGELERAVPAEGDIPGVGVADSRAPGWALSAEGRRLRSLAQRTLVRMLRVDSGGVIGPDEITQYAEMYGLSTGATEQQFRDGVAAMRADFDAGALGVGAAGSGQSHEHAEVGFTPD